MLNTVYGNELSESPKLAHTMFTDRAKQFKERLAWNVCVDQNGHEKDEYDALNPIYLIWERVDGSHGGSLRFLPTVCRTMINDKFSQHLGFNVRSQSIWECTRFCLSPDADHLVSWNLLMGALEIGLEYSVEQFVGIFDERMVRVYRRLGWRPEVIGKFEMDGVTTYAGLWPVKEQARHDLVSRNAARSAAPSTQVADAARPNLNHCC